MSSNLKIKLKLRKRGYFKFSYRYWVS